MSDSPFTTPLRQIRHEKDCSCNATASAGAVRVIRHMDKKTMKEVVTISFQPKLACDQCGKIWKEITE